MRKEPSAEEIAIAQTAVKEEARNHDLANPLQVEKILKVSQKLKQKISCSGKSKR